MKHILSLMLAFAAMPLAADPARIDHVGVSTADGRYTFNVTISHADTGWDHYVDAWRILDLEGNVLGTRDLAHPHIEEQPFMRSLSNVQIPEGITTVRIEAHDSITGWGPETHEVEIR